MTRPTIRHALALTLAAAAAPCLSAGCGSQATLLCMDICNCENCASDQEQACIARIQGSEMLAGEVGCSSEASDYEGCLESTGTCIDSFWSSQGCDLQLKTVTTCLAKSHCALDSAGAVHCN